MVGESSRTSTASSFSSTSLTLALLQPCSSSAALQLHNTSSRSAYSLPAASPLQHSTSCLLHVASSSVARRSTSNTSAHLPASEELARAARLAIAARSRSWRRSSWLPFSCDNCILMTLAWRCMASCGGRASLARCRGILGRSRQGRAHLTNQPAAWPRTLHSRSALTGSAPWRSGSSASALKSLMNIISSMATLMASLISAASSRSCR